MLRVYVKILFFVTVFSLMTACGKAEYQNDGNSPTDSAAEEREKEPEADNKMYVCDELITDISPDDINTYELLDYMEVLVKYVNQPVASKEDIRQLDLLIFMFESSMYDPRTRYDKKTGYQVSPPVINTSVEIGVLAEYMCMFFGLNEKYFDKYFNSFINGEYVFQSEYIKFDPLTDEFRYSWGLVPGQGRFVLSRTDTKIYIDGNKITVKTIIISSDGGETKSADYTFIAHIKDGDIRYQLVSVDIYEDKRNMNDVILTIEGIDFTAPWYTVDRNGELEYYTSMPIYFYDNDGQSWDPAYEPEIWIRNKGIKNGVAYIGVNYYFIRDTYILDIENKMGRWMSGAEDIEVFYEAEISYFEELKAKNEADDEGVFWPSYYHNYSIMTMSRQYDFALLRRSKTLFELPGEYFMRNLNTGEEVFICDSYTVKYGISYMHENFKWLTDEHLQINVWLGGESSYYDVIYDGKNWLVSESDEDY